MTDDELMILKKFNAERTQNEKDKIMEEFNKMDEFIHEQFRKNARHLVFDNQIDLEKAMCNDFNPFNTFELK